MSLKGAGRTGVYIPTVQRSYSAPQGVARLDCHSGGEVFAGPGMECIYGIECIPGIKCIPDMERIPGMECIPGLERLQSYLAWSALLARL